MPAMYPLGMTIRRNKSTPPRKLSPLTPLRSAGTQRRTPCGCKVGNQLDLCRQSVPHFEKGGLGGI